MALGEISEMEANPFVNHREVATPTVLQRDDWKIRRGDVADYEGTRHLWETVYGVPRSPDSMHWLYERPTLRGRASSGWRRRWVRDGLSPPDRSSHGVCVSTIARCSSPK